MSLPPSEIPQGAIRFNTDSQKLEFYAQGEWWNMVTDTPNLGVGADTTAGARGIAIGGDATSTPADTTIDYITITSTGNAVSFGTLGTASYNGTAVSSSTRGVCMGGRSDPSSTKTMQYITISSTGNSTTFGDLIDLYYGSAGISNSTRGIAVGGAPQFGSPVYINDIEYITISSTGNAQDFGTSSISATYRGGCSSPTRGISFGGGVYPGTEQNIIEFITISTLGNAQDFGDLTTAYWRLGACSNAVRGVVAAGESPAGDNLNNIEYITIATTGNSVDFGDTTQSGQHTSGASSPTRGVFLGRQGGSPYPNLNVIDYVTIMTQGNAVDFGDLTVPRQGVNACSNAHGGL